MRHLWPGTFIIGAAVRIALLSPPLLPVPPERYGGVERVVGVLAEGLHERGHDVTLFAPGDSSVSCRLVPTVERALWNYGYEPDPSRHYEHTLELVVEAGDEFDIIHSHLDQRGFELGGRTAVPVMSTLHGRTDVDPLAAALAAHPEEPVVAISHSQRSFAPNANWLATIHNGLDLDTLPLGTGGGGYVVFVGRLSHDKGVRETIEAARIAGMRLLVAAKALAPNELEVYDTVVAQAVDEGVAEFIGEVDRTARDRLFAAAEATLMLSRWPEPFGLVAIESLAAGTPVIASRSGALPEIIEHGVDGFVVDSPAAAAAALAAVSSLDRGEIRRRALARFSAGRMIEKYEEIYMRAVGRSQSSHSKSV
jgi:glycosyltransferase involved in cell wall biosynthesis